MSPRNRSRTESEDNAALAEEAARIEARGALDDSSAADSAAMSEVAAAPVLTDAEVSAEVPAFEPPPWTPSPAVIPQWVIVAKRLTWEVDSLPADAAREELPRAEWIGGDVGYRYYKGGHVVATFRKGGYGVLKTAPVAEFDVDPEPAPEPPVL